MIIDNHNGTTRKSLSRNGIVTTLSSPILRSKALHVTLAMMFAMVLVMLTQILCSHGQTTHRRLSGSADGPEAPKSFDKLFPHAKEMTDGTRCWNPFTKAFWDGMRKRFFCGAKNTMGLQEIRKQFDQEENFNDFKNYLSNIGIKQTGSPGRSGCSFYKTMDNRFLIKEVPGGCGALKSSDYFTITKTNFIQKYIQHMKNSNLSLLVRYFAFFESKKAGKTRYWSIMNNWHQEEISECISDEKEQDCSNADSIHSNATTTAHKKKRIVLGSDLKGSLHGRQYSAEKSTWKDLDWIYLLKNVKPYHPEEDVCNKFLSYSGKICKAIVRDVQFLRDFNLMDYSWVPKLEIIPVDEEIDENDFSEPESTHTSSYKLPIKFTIPGESAHQSMTVKAILHFGGIIDFLQRNNWIKLGERAINIRKTEASAKGNKEYADRFIMFASKFFSSDIAKWRDNKLTVTEHLEDIAIPKFDRGYRILFSDNDQGTRELYETRSTRSMSRYEESIRSYGASNRTMFHDNTRQQYKTLKLLQDKRFGKIVSGHSL